MPNNLSICSKSVAHLLHRCGQHAEDEFSRSVGTIAITARQFSVLSAVADLDHPSQTQLCEFTGIDRSTLADIVRRLVARGWLSRRRTQNDARAYAVSVTAEGEKILEQVLPISLKIDASLLSAMNADEQATFQSLLHKFLTISRTQPHQRLSNDVGASSITVPLGS